jgi:endonuclease/exonuclease/phosphatase family metal-dependent hydrolase
MARNFLILSVLLFVLNGCLAKTNSSDSTIQLNLMTFNVRYDNPADGENNWKFRREFVSSMILKNNVDVMGTQEVLNNQLTDLLGSLPQYAYAGVGRTDGKTAGEYSAVFYRKDKFSLLRSGTFWLSENPNAIGIKGWDAALERIVTWVVLKDKTTAKEFAFLNTHFDHIGVVARRESAKLLLAKVDEIANGLPVIVSGDLNSTPDSEPVKILTDISTSNHLSDSRAIATEILGPTWTFHGFGTVPLESRTIIDYIFVKNKVTVQQVSVISEMLGKIYLSDHNPVLVKATL